MLEVKEDTEGSPPSKGLSPVVPLSPKPKSPIELKKPSLDVIPVESASENRIGDWRNMRRIIAEDPEWSLATVPLLNELVIKHIVKNFENKSEVLKDLLTKDQKKVLAQISTDLPLKVTALLVDDEGFWERCCHARWELCDVSSFGNSWKRMYFERNLQQIIELFVPEASDSDELDDTVMLSANFIKKLDIRQLLPPVPQKSKGPDFDEISEAASDAGDDSESDHFNFGPVLKKLSFLEEFHVTYGVRDCGMNFEWSLFQFTARDCLQLSECIAALPNLKVFRLHRSKMDDDKVRVFISHILDHPGLIELDLSHNIIGDRGARAIGKFLNNHSKLVKLNLCNNQIRVAGAQAIAYALTKNNLLQYLNLRLNRMGDEGGQAITRALMKNRTLVEVNLSSNDLVEPTAAILNQVLSQNLVLRYLDLSCNRLGPDGGKQLQEGMEENKTILHIDLRLTEVGQEAEYCINQILRRNQEADREQRIKDSEEINAQYRKKTAEPQAAHRFQLPTTAILA
ncbi:unnamed protein product [Lymnaea stagnalis]|uniref:T-complex-associated testis-expressed protein 1 n=1 Tax=Lymnaea stagnalis TaxID=6523 RepID=A0AAV2HQB3_LYMST